MSHVSIWCPGSSFLLVRNQTHADELPHNQEVHMWVVHLWRLVTLGSFIPPRRTARRMSLLWNAAGRPCGWNELTSKVSINHAAMHPRTTSTLHVLHSATSLPFSVSVCCLPLQKPYRFLHVICLFSFYILAHFYTAGMFDFGVQVM